MSPLRLVNAEHTEGAVVSDIGRHDVNDVVSVVGCRQHGVQEPFPAQLVFLHPQAKETNCTFISVRMHYFSAKPPTLCPLESLIHGQWIFESRAIRYDMNKFGQNLRRQSESMTLVHCFPQPCPSRGVLSTLLDFNLHEKRRVEADNQPIISVRRSSPALHSRLILPTEMGVMSSTLFRGCRLRR
jgi:hypothetical protein